MSIKNKIKAFTLIEIMFGILIVSGVLIVAFDTISKVSFGKIKLIDSANIEKETFFFAQRLYETIKKGGTIDYEEYWNRKVVNLGGSSLYQSGHYIKRTGFGNFGYNGQIGTDTYGHGFYICRSLENSPLGIDGCIVNHNDDGIVNSMNDGDQTGQPQRYGEYSFQFIDYNSNADDDWGDEDQDPENREIGDDDDEFLGDGPKAFTGGIDVKELYLISADKSTRTLIRVNYNLDPKRPNGTSCISSDGGKTYTGTGCLGRVEFLKLEGRDWGMDHVEGGTSDSDGTQYDGVIDTWLIDKDFTGDNDYSNPIIAGSNNENYWLPLFSDNINVKSLKIYPFPNKDIKKSWSDMNSNANIAPYVRLEIVLAPSWAVKKRIKGKVPEFKYSTTISLNDIYSR